MKKEENCKGKKMTLGNYFLLFMPASDTSCIVFTGYLGFIRCQFERSGKYYRLSYDSWNVYLPHHALFSLAVWDLYDANLKGVVFWPLANSAGDFHRGYFKPRTPARQCYSSLSLPVLHCDIVSRKLFENSFAFKMQKYVLSFGWFSVHLACKRYWDR